MTKKMSIYTTTTFLFAFYLLSHFSAKQNKNSSNIFELLINKYIILRKKEKKLTRQQIIKNQIKKPK